MCNSISITVSGTTVMLSFASGVYAGETLTASFNGLGLPGGAPASAVAAFTIGLTNNTMPFAGSSDGSVGGATAGTGGPFVLTGAYVNSGFMTLTFSRTLAAGTTPTGAFWISGSTNGS